MIHQHLCLPECEWCVDIYYDVKPKDTDHILDLLWDLGCPERDMYKAEDLISSGVPNEGLTYSNRRERRTLIVITEVTDPFQFLNSLSHEREHLLQAIGKADGLDPYGEPIAYLSGDISMALAKNAWNAMRDLFGL